MSDSWTRLREACNRLEPDAALRTPHSERLFEVESTAEDRIDVRFQDSGQARSLQRDQFEVLIERLTDGPLSIEGLPSGVEPYAAVLSLSPDYISVDGTLTWDTEDGVAGESPHYVSPEEARTPPERIHDDALLLAETLSRLETDTLTSLDTERLTDLYVLLSDVQRGADRLRTSVSSILLDRLGPDQQLHGRFGTVRYTTRERRHVEDDETVLDALDTHGIPHEWVLGVDPDKLDVVLTVTDLEESAVYDHETQEYVQKTDTDEGVKVSLLEGLADRLEEVEGGEALRADIVDLERRLDEALSAG